MQYIVPNLYDNLNLNTLPKIIKEEFYRLGYWMYSVEDVFYKPYFRIYNFDIDNEKIKFYAHEDAETTVNKHIENKKVLNEDYKILTHNEFQREYLIEYGRGFYKGYTSYSNELKNKKNQIFEPDNKQIAHKVFSKAIKRKDLRFANNFPLSFFPLHEIKQIEKKIKNVFEYYSIDKKLYHKSGYESGVEYKAWEIILNNPTLFEDIFIEQLGELETKEETFIETPELKLKDIPSFNLQQRYDIFKRLGFDIKILQIDTNKQTSTHKILALIMGISPDNAKHLLNNTYKDYKLEDKEDLEEYFAKINVKL